LPTSVFLRMHHFQSHNTVHSAIFRKWNTKMTFKVKVKVKVIDNNSSIQRL